MSSALSQEERLKVLKKLKNSTIKILITTDLVSYIHLFHFSE